MNNDHAMLLTGYPMFQSTDIDAVEDFVVRKLSPHKLDVIGRRTNTATQLNGISFYGTKLFCSSYGEDIEILPEQSDCFITQTTLAGCTEVESKRNRAQTVKGSTVVISPSENYRMRLWRGSRRLTILFEREALEQHLCQLLNADIKQPLVFDLSMPDGNEHSQSWLRSLLYFCEQLSLFGDVGASEHFLQSVNKMLMSLLLDIQPHNYSHFLKRETVLKNPRHVRSAITYIEEHLRQSISLSELAAAVCVSTRTLQKGFKTYTGKTPKEYITNKRIRAIHEELRNCAAGEQVADILHKYSVASFGHFSRAYKEVYGCTPSETMRKH
ncbi:AraC family transcriptional regulator [Pseudomaricurvus alkylphenolicus]|uniref:helix-turn-helix transcriptional regulator n=1 Tax=Pseudomaricurvus alkylphenolicus TaxID=1306991 RepID=UPI001420ACC9|nr:AraC family transcriptional regulator [Pseudomaricurvus alkylphenolicus]NIB40666.1 AraC family transcriptional regulator [Pseudomaricurvus alkylphenolicus]